MLAYADQPLTPLVQRAADESAAICAAGGMPALGTSGPPAYALLGQNVLDAVAGFFFSVEPQVFAGVFPMLTRNPCGDPSSYVTAPATTLPNLASIEVPVLVVGGTRDALYPPPAGRRQAARYTGSRAVTFRSLPRTGHALSFERGRRALQRHMDSWLTDNRF